MDLHLQQRSVVVTGAGSNIGRAVALTFAAEGARLMLADIDADQTERVAVSALQSGAAAAQFVPTDVTDLEQVESMMAAANERHGSVDVFVNSVGWGPLSYFPDRTPRRGQ